MAAKKFMRGQSSCANAERGFSPARTWAEDQTTPYLQRSPASSSSNGTKKAENKSAFTRHKLTNIIDFVLTLSCWLCVDFVFTLCWFCGERSKIVPAVDLVVDLLVDLAIDLLIDLAVDLLVDLAVDLLIDSALTCSLARPSSRFDFVVLPIISIWEQY